MHSIWPPIYLTAVHFDLKCSVIIYWPKPRCSCSFILTYSFDFDSFSYTVYFFRSFILDDQVEWYSLVSHEGTHKQWKWFYFFDCVKKQMAMKISIIIFHPFSASQSGVYIVVGVCMCLFDPAFKRIEIRLEVFLCSVARLFSFRAVWESSEDFNSTPSNTYRLLPSGFIAFSL